MEKEIKEENIEEEKVEEVKQGVNKVLVCLILLVLLIGIYIVLNKINANRDNKRFFNEYSSVSENNVFVYKTADEVIELLENGTGVVYLGFPECKWCQAYVPILNEIAKEKDIEEIYYFNIRNDRSENSEKYQKIVELLGDFLDKDAEDKPRVYVPEVVVVVDGKVVGHNNETATITDSSLLPDVYWTSEKEEELKNTLETMLSKINVCIDCNE